jgi:phospholipid/cholesterol/gamma-HCH transport system substrate-binding protein
MFCVGAIGEPVKVGEDKFALFVEKGSGPAAGHGQYTPNVFNIQRYYGVDLNVAWAIAKTIKESLRDDQGKNMVKEIIANIHDITGSLKRLSTGNEDKINQIIDEVKAISEQIAFETDRGQKDSLMSDLSKMGPILDKADSAVSDLKVIIADLKDGKGTVGKLLRDDAVVDQVSQTLSSVNRLVNRINNIEADIGLSTGANTRLGTDTRFDMDIYPAPERFFRLGIVTNEFGPQNETETDTYTRVDNGATVRSNTRKINRSDFKFNFQR